MGKGPKPSPKTSYQHLMLHHLARPVSQSYRGPVSQAAVHQINLAQQLHNLLGPRHPAISGSAQLSSAVA